MEIPTLKTERLLLRPFRIDDLDLLAAMNADIEVMRYIAEVQDRSAAFRSLCASNGHWTIRGFGPWAVEELATGRMIGRAGLLHWEGSWPAVEIGYALERSAWGKGYATEAALASRDYAHRVLGARGLISQIHPDNAASIRVAERMGARYQHDHLIKQDLVRVYVHPDPVR
jgi:RimJ/RimL family protein N-acetyltransferase